MEFDFINFLKSEIKRLFSSNIFFKLELEKECNNLIDPNNFFLVSSYDKGIESNFFKRTTEFATHVSVLKNVSVDDHKYRRYKINIDIIQESEKYRYSIKIRVSNYVQKYFKILYNSAEEFGAKNKFPNWEDDSFLTINVFNVHDYFLTESLFMIFIISLFKYIIPAVHGNFKKTNIQYNVYNFDLFTFKKNTQAFSDMMETIFFLDRDLKEYKKAKDTILKYDNETLSEIIGIEIDLLISDYQLIYQV